MTETVFNHPWVSSVIAGFLLVGVIGKLMKVSFERIAKWYLYVSAFCIVIVMNSSLFPFIGGKDYFFRFSIELSLVSLVLWWAFEARKGELKERFLRLWKNPLVKAVVVFMAAFLLATLFAYDMHAAFWSNYERGEGGFQMLHYLGFFLLIGLLLRDEADWKTMFKMMLTSAGLMIIYGVLGNYGVGSFIGAYAGGTPPTGFWHILIDGRFQGSLGNPAYVAPYLMFAMFYAAYLWVSKKREGQARTLAAWGYGALLVVFLFFFILAQTRGAFLGLAAGIFAFLVYLIVASRGALRKWSAIFLIAVALIGVGLYSVRNLPAVQNLPEGRLLQISLSDTTAQTRLWVWGEAWKGFLERPIFGWGPENFSPVFDKYFDVRFYVPGGTNETWFDRAHSVVFDYLSETGIIGLLAYVAMFVVFAWLFIKKYRHDRTAQNGAGHSSADVVKKGLLVAMPIAYLVQGLAIFDVLPMYINVFLFLGFSAYYLSHNSTNQ